MRQLEAMTESILLAELYSNSTSANYRGNIDPDGPCSITHFKDMLKRASIERYSMAKLGRHLGFIQGVLCARGLMSLDELKDLNRKYAE